MRRFIALLAPCILLTACSSKQLTERSARSLISDNVSSHPYLVSLAPIAPLMNRTLVDYSATPVAGNDATRILHTLIELKDVVSKVETVSYPKITGTFIKSSNWGLDASGKHDPTGRKDNYVFSENQAANALSGQFFILLTTQRNHQTTFAGSIQQDGAIELRLQDTGEVERLVYHESPPTASFDDRNGKVQYVGKSSGEKIQTKWYEYSFSSEAQKRISKFPRSLLQGNSTQDFFGSPANYVAAGTFEVGEITNLRLESETNAVATAAWSVSLNDVGKAFHGDKKPIGKSEVKFAKKPDGTWIIAPTEE